MAMAPIDTLRWSSKIGFQVTPAFVLLKMPPAAPPTYRIVGSPGTPTNTEMRPAWLAGPMLRHFRPASTCVSADVVAESAARRARLRPHGHWRGQQARARDGQPEPMTEDFRHE